jgi:hypothetical protein
MFHSMGTGEDKVIDKNKPIMDSTRLTNCRYLITTNSSKWVIPNKFDPFLSSDKVIIMKKHADYGCVAQSWIGGTDGKDDGIESDWVKFALLDRAGESKSKESDNPVIQHFAPRNGILGNGEFDDTYMSIRNIFFNVDYLQKKCKGSGNLMKVVEDIWNDFSDDYGGVYKFIQDCKC